ncbi:ATP-binding protein [Nocardia otitidiscaviarum]|uniref:ATP-binding protein n=1 Tax=Nocardia otitidiscaviarum TaxID=1823 RepID=UPI0018941062|nr:ATP-binding protein [Nocardia otitidiscaviarum]MBF6241034.1 ATP-binding protein [Nocardia otitidiscaviarum]
MSDDNATSSSAGSAVPGTPPASRRASTQLAATLDAARRARRFVDEVCRSWYIAPTRDIAFLVATELVENALMHSRVDGDLTLELHLHGQHLRIAVHDPDPAAPLPPSATGGRPGGLAILARLTVDWGSAPGLDHGKVVWALVTVDQPAPG